MKLPNADRAVVEIKKLRDYSLNPNHPKGKHKARRFLAALGLQAGDAEALREMIMEAILITEARHQQATVYGQRFVVDFSVPGVDLPGETPVKVRSAWIVRNGEDFPRLTSCFIL